MHPDCVGNGDEIFMVFIAQMITQGNLKNASIIKHSFRSNIHGGIKIYQLWRTLKQITAINNGEVRAQLQQLVSYAMIYRNKYFLPILEDS